MGRAGGMTLLRRKVGHEYELLLRRRSREYRRALGRIAKPNPALVALYGLERVVNPPPPPQTLDAWAKRLAAQSPALAEGEKEGGERLSEASV